MSSNADPLLDAPRLTPQPEPSAKKITCEFCGCQLIGKGDYVSLSERARKLRDLEEDNQKLQDVNVGLNKTIEDLRSAKPQPEPARKSGW